MSGGHVGPCGLEPGLNNHIVLNKLLYANAMHAGISAVTELVSISFIFSLVLYKLVSAGSPEEGVPVIISRGRSLFTSVLTETGQFVLL